jgi:hypothetical protein
LSSSNGRPKSSVIAAAAALMKMGAGVVGDFAAATGTSSMPLMMALLIEEAKERLSWPSPIVTGNDRTYARLAPADLTRSRSSRMSFPSALTSNLRWLIAVNVGSAKWSVSVYWPLSTAFANENDEP